MANRAKTVAADGDLAMMTFAGFSDSRAEEEASPPKKRSPGKKEAGSRFTAAISATADPNEQMIDFADADTNGSTATEASPANGDPADPAQAVAADDALRPRARLHRRIRPNDAWPRS
ncbi:hypothetical protein OC842_005649 [Tilletia horrida]|uniref:Uncharacterized protein n=1 Tax=Tilletia horrida TaxID=155126 RepID=A0AAN6G6Y4_9BASI|nr:hypothetical protein OC842_005649 [Tilletia horrida]